MKKLGLLSIIAVITLISQGCAEISEVKQYDNTVDMVKVTGVKKDTNSYSMNTTTTTSLADTVEKIANQLLSTMNIKDIDAVAITSFVDLNKLNKTTRFGRIMSESFFNALNKRGVNVMDFRGQKSLSINADGEFFLSRNIKKIHSPIKNSYVLVGTYAKIEEGIIINSRILDNISGRVIASSRVIYHSNNCELLESCATPAAEPMIKVRTINVTTDGCSTERCP